MITGQERQLGRLQSLRHASFRCQRLCEYPTINHGPGAQIRQPGHVARVQNTASGITRPPPVSDSRPRTAWGGEKWRSYYAGSGRLPVEIRLPNTAPTNRHRRSCLTRSVHSINVEIASRNASALKPDEWITYSRNQCSPSLSAGMSSVIPFVAQNSRNYPRVPESSRDPCGTVTIWPIRKPGSVQLFAMKPEG